MCGIAGMIDLGKDRRPAPRDRVSVMAHAILHRGPDDDGFLDRPGLSLANRRLSIVGLADGKQPIINEDQTVWTVFNGELFDYPETRKFLEGKGHVFRTHTDTELIPHLWEEFGPGMFEHLKGQYAFCLWDSRTNEYILARDRAGICPLYYAVRKHAGTDWLLFGSEIRALFASGLVDPKADPTALNHIFTFYAMPGPATVFQGVSILLPGRYLHFKPGSASPDSLVQQRTYWQVTYPDRGKEDYGRDEKTVVDEYERLFVAAVNRRLRADVPVVSYLSGGVDSSLVVAVANKALGRAIPTFTVAVQEKGLNEEDVALQVAKHLGCEPIVVPCGHADLRSGYPELIETAEYPVVDTSCLPLMELAKAVHARGFKVALTGEGADEWLGGYPWFKTNRLLSNFGSRGSNWIRQMVVKITGQPSFPKAAVLHAQESVGGHNGWLDVYGIMSLNKLRFFGPGLRDRTLHSSYDDLELPPELRRWHPFHREMYLGARVNLPGHQLAGKGDRVAMHSSVEARFPFLDEDLIAYTAGLHPRWKLRSVLKDKWVERLVAARWLPKEVAFRRKKMFRAPMDSWFKPGKRSTTDTWIDQVLSQESIEKTGYFDYAGVAAAREKLKTLRGLGRTGLEMGLTAVTATQLWHHIFLGGGLTEIPSRAGLWKTPSLDAA